MSQSKNNNKQKNKQLEKKVNKTQEKDIEEVVQKDKETVDSKKKKTTVKEQLGKIANASGKKEDKKGQKNKKSPENMKQQLFSQFATALLAVVAFIFIFSNFVDQKTDDKVSITEVVSSVKSQQVESIEVVRTELAIIYKDGTEKSAKRETDAPFTETLTNLGVTAEQLQEVKITVSNPTGFAYTMERLLPYLFPILLLALIFWMFFRPGKGGPGGGGAMQAFSFGSSRAKFIDPNDESQKIKFDDVAGAEEAKQDLAEIVEFLKTPKKFTDIGAEIPKGALLMGEPGTGKTLLARAVAGEAGVTFFSVSGSEFVEMFVGVGASRVRDLFKMAKKEAPAIIFIDEIDAIGRVRGGGTGGGNDEREQTLNQILVEMDGFEKNQAVIILAATNRPEILDPALLRPGRFDRRVSIDLPDREAREAILGIHSKKKKTGDDVKLDEIARRTPGMSGADLSSVMNEAAIAAARDKRKQISQLDVVQAVEKVAMGPERRSRRIDAQEKELTAYHEVGHALVATVLEHADPVTKVTIIPRGRALGYVYQTPDVERYTVTKNDFLARIAVALAGYATEKKYFGDVSTGPSNDLQQATAMARNMVTRWGMSERAGVLAYDGNGKAEWGDQGVHKEYSADTGRMLDEEVKKIMDEQMALVEKTLDQYQDAHHALVEKLKEVDTLDREEYEVVVKEIGIPVKNRKMRKPSGLETYKKTLKG